MSDQQQRPVTDRGRALAPHKHSKMRENVVICAGEPDRDGLVLPMGVTEFELLAAFGCGKLPPTRHVRRAWLHLAGTTELIALVRVAEPR